MEYMHLQSRSLLGRLDDDRIDEDDVFWCRIVSFSGFIFVLFSCQIAKVPALRELPFHLLALYQLLDITTRQSGEYPLLFINNVIGLDWSNLDISWPFEGTGLPRRHLLVFPDEDRSYAPEDFLANVLVLFGILNGAFLVFCILLFMFSRCKKSLLPRNPVVEAGSWFLRIFLLSNFSLSFAAISVAHNSRGIDFTWRIASYLVLAFVTAGLPILLCTVFVYRARIHRQSLWSDQFEDLSNDDGDSMKKAAAMFSPFFWQLRAAMEVIAVPRLVRWTAAACCLVLLNKHPGVQSIVLCGIFSAYILVLLLRPFKSIAALVIETVFAIAEALTLGVPILFDYSTDVARDNDQIIAWALLSIHMGLFLFCILASIIVLVNTTIRNGGNRNTQTQRTSRFSINFSASGPAVPPPINQPPPRPQPVNQPQLPFVSPSSPLPAEKAIDNSSMQTKPFVPESEGQTNIAKFLAKKAEKRELELELQQISGDGANQPTNIAIFRAKQRVKLKVKQEVVSKEPEEEEMITPRLEAEEGIVGYGDRDDEDDEEEEVVRTIVPQYARQGHRDSQFQKLHNYRVDTRDRVKDASLE